ncbi:MAG: DinB family protein [Chloracidobacterium sp.]|nr:DinB family protein [Chloracidobacterium sp.]
MKKIFVISLFAILLSALQSFAQAPAKVFTEKDRDFALKYLNDTKADYIVQLTNLSNKQLNFRAAEGRWTIAEIAEHITVVETALFGTVTDKVLKSPVPECKDPFRVADTAIILSVTNRQQKFTAPEPVRPNGRWKTREDLISSFEKTRNTTIDFIKNNQLDLRNHFGQAPMGTMDAYQWILFMTGHSERHLAQLKEVKVDKKYPKK